MVTRAACGYNLFSPSLITIHPSVFLSPRLAFPVELAAILNKASLGLSLKLRSERQGCGVELLGVR